MKFIKGQSGNPNGAPKRTWTWSGELQKAVEKAEQDGRTVKEVVAESLINEAKKGNILAQKELMNRMDGLPKQDVEVEGKLTHLIITREEEDNDDESPT